MAHYIGRQEYTIEVTLRGNLLLAMLTQGNTTMVRSFSYISCYRRPERVDLIIIMH